ncbi:hypothetical protein HELRODRAFT_166107 [Helobdella robusta]|uniref:Uncharacterized protein n=1 Tax=Helobdella robusta TaxID=6412 RepID=T1EXR9_HELRO|nr:hypothetical protein HELRODRAFT_166107 [Helobdella robusta]ESN90441.1 hypothetical protein HELRODRAFT_166107 [Helobdella robusta]
MTGDFGFEKTVSASTMAIKDAQEAGLLRGFNVSIFIIFIISVIYMDDKCDGKEALGKTSELHYIKHVSAFVGLPCSAEVHFLALSNTFATSFPFATFDINPATHQHLNMSTHSMKHLILNYEFNTKWFSFDIHIL